MSKKKKKEKKGGNKKELIEILQIIKLIIELLTAVIGLIMIIEKFN